MEKIVSEEMTRKLGLGRSMKTKEKRKRGLVIDRPWRWLPHEADTNCRLGDFPLYPGGDGARSRDL